MTVLERADASLARLRSSVAGEALWLVSLSGLAAIHLASLTPAFLRPDLIDFSAFVDNASAWLSGTPYPATSRDPNTPHAILVFVPFVFLPLRLGLAIWIGVTYLCFFLTLRAVSRELGLRMSGAMRVTLVAFALATPPSRDVFVNGNMVWPLALVFTAAWRLARRERLSRAAAVLGVLATVKPFLGMFGLLFLVRRRWSALGAMTAAALVTLALALGVTGSSAFLAWFDAVGRITWYDVRFNSSVFGFLARVCRPDAIAWGVVLVALTAGTVGVLRSRAASLSGDWLFVFLAALLASPLGWRYYLCLIVGPLVATLLRAPVRGFAVAALGALAVSPVPSLTSASPVLLATVGSIPMWTALCAWFVFASPRTDVEHPKETR